MNPAAPDFATFEVWAFLLPTSRDFRTRNSALRGRETSPAQAYRMRNDEKLLQRPLIRFQNEPGSRPAKNPKPKAVEMPRLRTPRSLGQPFRDSVSKSGPAPGKGLNFGAGTGGTGGSDASDSAGASGSSN